MDKLNEPAPGTFLPGFAPLSALWESTGAPYPSEQSARWAVRQLRTRLAETGAIALHRGRTMVHLQRMAQVVQEQALARARQRYAASAPASQAATPLHDGTQTGCTE